jgi:DNA-binding MarR family transcriptional regulator
MFFLKDLPTPDILETYHAKFPAMNVKNVDEALHMLRQASLLMRELDAYFAEQGMSQLRYLILVVLDREPGRNGQLMASEVAARIDVSRPVMTRTLQSLISDGWVEMEVHGDDARARLIRLTPTGREKLHLVLPGFYEVIDTFMAARDEG